VAPGGQNADEQEDQDDDQDDSHDIFLLFLFSEIQGSNQTGAAKFDPGKDNGRLFHDQIILYGLTPWTLLAI